jgi:hypothetical protein
MLDEEGPDVPFAPQSFINNQPWDEEGEEYLWLLTPFELDVTPKGTILTSIWGDRRIVGHDYIDKDTRFGYIAFGLTDDQFKH